MKAWFWSHFYIIYLIEFLIALILVIYGLVSPDGFSAKGYTI